MNDKKKQINMPVNIVEMKLKTQIENNLLNKINVDLQECVVDLEYIQKTHKYAQAISSKPIEMIIQMIPDKIISLENLIGRYGSDVKQDYLDNLVPKLFNHSCQFYWLFQYFYLKKKDFMGMNLTGLVNGKMETGLSFRNTISKITFEQFVFKELGLPKDIFVSDSDSNILTQSIWTANVYKVKSSGYKWADSGLSNVDSHIHNYIWIISDLDKQEYFVLVNH